MTGVHVRIAHVVTVLVVSAVTPGGVRVGVQYDEVQEHDRDNRRVLCRAERRETPWVVAWAGLTERVAPCVGYVRQMYSDPADWHFFDRSADLGVHRAFCAGHVPPPVYADWLEENGCTLPPEAFAILRGWV